MPRSANGGIKNLIPAKPGERGSLNRGGRRKGSPNKVSRERTMAEIGRIAFSDPVNLFQRTYGSKTRFTLREIDQMPPEVRACIASVKVKTENLTAGDDQQDQTVEVRLWNKVQALEMLAKHFKIIDTKDTSLEHLDVLIEVLQRWKEKHRLAQDQAITVQSLPPSTDGTKTND